MGAKMRSILKLYQNNVLWLFRRQRPQTHDNTIIFLSVCCIIVFFRLIFLMQRLIGSQDDSILDKDEFKSRRRPLNRMGLNKGADYKSMVTEHKSTLDAKEPSDEKKSKTSAVKSKKTSKTKNKDSKKKEKASDKKDMDDIDVLQGAGAFASAVAQVSRIGKGPKPKKKKKEEKPETIKEQVDVTQGNRPENVQADLPYRKYF